MFKINKYFKELSDDYFFSTIGARVASFKEQNPSSDIIKLGIGDVTLPLIPKVIDALLHSTEEMANCNSFRGYGPEQGYEFLREAISKFDYEQRQVDIKPDEIFVSDGTKSDIANIQELFAKDCKVAICDPVYPVYRDSNILAGRGENIYYMPCTEENGFMPELPEYPTDILYLCSPNNPTGVTMDKQTLSKFVDYAKKNNALILFDGAYSAYIKDSSLPKSIYEIDGAKEVAIEFRSFSKTAGFTGVRSAYTVVPKSLPENLNQLWRRRQSTKFNGVSYMVQRATEAIYSAEGQNQIKNQIDYYMGNAEIMSRNLKEIGHVVYGGTNSPYLWWKIPKGFSSDSFFDAMLKNCAVVGTPGTGFGKFGEGFFRLTAFGNRMRTLEAMERIRKWKIV